MSAISLKSISGITSITTPAGVDNQLTLHTNNTTERVKIDVAGNVHVNNHISIAGITTATGMVKLADGMLLNGGNISLLDRPDGSNHNLFFGTGAKAVIYHDGSGFNIINNTGHSYIGVGAGSKDLYLYAQASGNVILQQNTGVRYVKGVGSDASVQLFFNNNEKLKTINTGIDVTGAITADDLRTDNSQTFYLTTANDFRFRTTGGTERLRILSTGETCINDVDLIVGYGQNTQAQINFFANSDNASARYARIRKNYNSPFNLEYFASTSDSDQAHVFYSDLTTERFRITSDGKVSIGGFNPSVAGLSISNSSTNRGFEFDTGSGFDSTSCIRAYDRPTTAYKSLGLTGSDIRFGINDVEKLRITSDGRIGQGATSPSYDFHSYKASGTTRARLQTNGTSGSDYADMVVQAGGGNYIQQFIYGTGYGYMNGAASQSMTYGNIANAPVYFSTNNTSRALFDTSGNFNILDGNLIVASGHGISFSATSDGGNSSTSSSELLDDYEEGSWTPVIKGSSSPGTATYVSRSARYVKVGRLVHVYADVRWSAHNGSGGLEVHGLPYAQIGGYWGHFGVNYNSGMSYATDVHYGWANIGGDYIRYWETNSSGGSGTLALDSVVSEVHFYGHYLTTA